MRPEALLAGAAVVALLGTVATAALVPGFLVDDPGDRDEPPARINVAETTLSTGEITAETATLEVTTFLQHRGGTAENVTVTVRATDEASGLVADTTETDLGALDDGGERSVPLSVTVPREGSYEVRTLLYVDGNRVDTAATSVRGVEALTPPYAESTVEFHRFDRQPGVEYAIESTDGDDATLSVTSYLHNDGDEQESDLRLVVTARQAESNVVAARTETVVGEIDPGRTTQSELSVTVPDGYNYHLDATLWRDGVVLESTRAAANLDPRETIDAGETVDDVEFETGDFESDRPVDEPRATPESEVDSQPGFGAAVAVVAALLAAGIVRKWSG